MISSLPSLADRRGVDLGAGAGPVRARHDPQAAHVRQRPDAEGRRARVAPKVLARSTSRGSAAAIAETVERAKANDPKALRARIAELEKQLAAKPSGAKVEMKSPGALPARAPDRPRTSARATIAAATGAANARIGTPEMKVLNAVAWWQSIGIESPVASAVAFLAGYTSTSSSFERARGALRTAGLIEFPTQGALRMTASGAAIAAIPETPLDNAAMHAAVMARLDGPQRKVLQPVIDAYPKPVSQERAAELAGYSHTSSSFERARGALRTFGLIDFPRAGELRATDLLFPEGA
jgi:hypothetical protein